MTTLTQSGGKAMTPEIDDAPWVVHIEVMDRAIETRNTTEAVRAWRAAYAAALEHPGWGGLVQVASASLRIGRIAGFAKASEARARETYWTALFRARRQGSLAGVLQTAEAFGVLGDHAMVEQCIRVAQGLAALGGDAATAARVHAIAADLVRRYVEIGRAEPG